MSENTPEDALQTLITDWLDWKATATALGVSVTQVRTLIREHHLAAAVPSPGAGQQVPAELVMDGEIVKGVPGLLTLFADGGWDDREKLTWLFTADESLPGRPIDALRENRGSEVKRRAQALAL
ncbi:MAG: Rv2175c family DNA-binding protein [Marmoricola sp.]